MKKIIKKGMAFVLAFAMTIAFMPAFPGGVADAVSFNSVNINTEFSVSSSDPVYYKAYIPESTSIEGMYAEAENWAVVFKCISAGGTPNITQVDASGSGSQTQQIWGGKELEATKKAAGKYVYFKITGGLGSKFVINIYPYPGNSTEESAYQVFDDVSVKGFSQLTECISKHDYGVQYYYIKAEEKAKYRIKSDDFSLYVKNGSGEYEFLEAGKTATFTVKKGNKLYIEVVTKQKAGTVKICRDIFNRMTSMKFAKSSYSVLAEQSATMKLNFSKLDQSRALESTIVSKGVYNSKGNYVESVTKEDINTYKASYKYPGIYTVKVKNSEGMVASTKLKVRPKKPVVSGYTATGTSKSSTVSIYDTLADIDGYAVYLKTSSGWKYKGLTKHNSKGYNEYTVKGLKANKTYYVKVKSYKKCGTEKVYSSYSNQMKIITAPSKAPKIKSAKGVKTTYYRSKSVWHPGHWDANDVYHSGYYTKTPAYSLAAVRVSFTKVKGASSYESQYGKIDNNMVGITLSGKAKAQTRKVKVRTVKKSGRATAYGPWSKYKSVRTKAAG